MSQLTINAFPIEILSHTLNLTIIPEYMLDHTLTRGPASAWSQNLRLKKAILRVCKTWNEVGLPMLYQEIIIRRAPQFMALSKVLEDNPDRLARLVCSITVEGHLRDEYVDLFKERLGVICRICPRLSSLSCKSLLSDMIFEKREINIPPHAAITHLQLPAGARYSTDIIRQLCGTLVTLGITFELPTNPGELGLELPGLCFPKLETLCCFTSEFYPSTHSPIASPIAFREWELPLLATLTFNNYIAPLPIDHCITICRAHGRKLKTLRIVTSNKENGLQEMLNLCPNLEYLHISSLSSIPSIQHPRLTRVDIGFRERRLGPQDSGRQFEYDFGQFRWDCPILKPENVRIVSRELDSVHDLGLLLHVTSQCDFKPRSDNPMAGVSFENLCVCRETLKEHHVQWIHFLSDHSDFFPRNRGLALPDPSPGEAGDDADEGNSEDSDASDQDDADSDSQSHEDYNQRRILSFPEALEVFEDSVVDYASDSDPEIESCNWQEFVEPHISDGIDYS